MNNSNKKHRKELKRKLKRAEIRRRKLDKPPIPTPLKRGIAHSIGAKPAQSVGFDKSAWGQGLQKDKND